VARSLATAAAVNKIDRFRANTYLINAFFQGNPKYALLPVGEWNLNYPRILCGASVSGYINNLGLCCRIDGLNQGDSEICQGLRMNNEGILARITKSHSH
jgi:hypothetical protein